MPRSLVTVVVAALAGVLGPLALAQDAKKIERGKAVFAEQKCKMCHSIGGVGSPKGPLDDVGGKLSPADIKQWIVDPKAMAAKAKAERKPAMRSYKELPAEDVDALVAYLSSLKKK